MKIGFCTMEKIENRDFNKVGSSRIRARWLCKYWPEAEEYRVGQKYDVLIFQKAYWQEMMEKFEGIKIFDLCDPDWMVPRPVIESMDYCHAMTTSTDALRDYVKKFTDKPVITVPDRLDLEEHTPRGKHEGMAKKVVWFGYSHNIHYIVKCFDWLIEKGLELIIISDTPYNAPMGFENLKIKNIHYDYNSVHENIKQADFALLPETSDDYAGRFKSNNKTTTCWALGLPVATMPEDLDRFMLEEERNKEQELRLKQVKEEYDVKLSIQQYKDLIAKLK